MAELRIKHALERFVALGKMVRKGNAYVDKLIDMTLNINTVWSPTETISRNTCHNDSVHYEPLPYLRLWRFTRVIKVTKDDVVYDIGCGLGRILCVFALRGVQKCVGIEISSRLAEFAERNAISLKWRKALIKISVDDATCADYLEGTVYCLFNPFGVETLQDVLERIRESTEKHPRRIRIAYFDPVHDEALRSCGWLKCYKQTKLVLGQGIDRASYWTNDLAC